MNVKELFLECIKQASTIVANVRPEQFGDATPDTEWDVKTLVAHTLYELAWTGDIVSGKTLDDVGNKYDGDLIGDNLAASWQNHRKLAEAAVSNADLKAVAHLSYADVTVEVYLRQAASDQLIHSWDLGVATNQHVEFDPRVASDIYEHTKTQLSDLAASGLFAPPLEVAKDASVQTKLLALYGRRG